MQVHLVQFVMAVLAFALLCARPRGEQLSRRISLAIIGDALRWRVVWAALWRRIGRPRFGVPWGAFRRVVARSWLKVVIGLVLISGAIALASSLLVYIAMLGEHVAHPTAGDYPF